MQWWADKLNEVLEVFSGCYRRIRNQVASLCKGPQPTAGARAARAIAAVGRRSGRLLRLCRVESVGRGNGAVRRG